jgi:hypothetical protein
MQSDGSNRIRLSTFVAAAISAIAGFWAAPSAEAAPLGPETLDQIATFCTSQGAFGVQFRAKADLASPTPEIGNFVYLYTVTGRREWAPFTKIQVQQTGRTELVYRIYGVAEFPSAKEARSVFDALSATLKVKGIPFDAYGELVSWPPLSSRPKPPQSGRFQVEGRALTAVCEDNGLVDQALAEGPPR